MAKEDVACVHNTHTHTHTHMHTVEYYSAIQKSYKNFVICSNIDGFGGRNAQTEKDK